MTEAAATLAPAPAAPISAAAALDTPSATPPATPATPAETVPATIAPTLALPGKDAKPEDWKAFYKALGAPDTPDGYKLPVPDGDAGEFAKTAAGWMAEAGLMPHQAQALAEKWNAHVAGLTASQSEAAVAAENARITALDTKNKAEEAALRNEWGQAHEANLGLAKQAVTQFLAPFAPAGKASEVISAVESAIGYAATIRMMHAIGKGLGTGQAHGLGENSGPLSAKSLAERLYPGG